MQKLKKSIYKAHLKDSDDFRPETSTPNLFESLFEALSLLS
ncbi:hypothetical protein SPAR25_1823 [Streptococcus pneumoniae GA11856]|nr:hypothetical protein SPAR25_1823 [Streptococcus pneumoniae GA11856]